MSINDYIVYLLTQTFEFAKMSPKKINNGMCEDFAMALIDRFPDGDMMWGDECPDLFGEFHEPDAHCFFKHVGLYYDSECPTGVDTPVKLPFFVRQEAHIKTARGNAKRAGTNPFPTRKDGTVAFCP